MRPVPQSLLLPLLLALCVLCSVQWWRESTLREMAVAQRNELAKVTAGRDDINARMKDRDSEILRLTAALGELRANSVAKSEVDGVKDVNTQLRETVAKQNEAIKDGNEAVAKQNSAILQANETIRKLAEERDALAKRVNDVTAKYNKLVAGKKSD